MTPLPPGSRIGIIGGGQLGRMLAMAAARLGYDTAILEKDPTCPAAQVAGRTISAAYDDPAGLNELSGLCDVVTYEFENVPVDAAKRLSGRVAVWPPARALEAAQDRLAEKTFLNSCGIETAPFEAVDSQSELDIGIERFHDGAVLKTRRLGYDGKGQHVFRPGAMDTAGMFDTMGGVPLILEGFVDFACEISVIVARSADGSVATYDPAENVHVGGILKTSTLPASITPETADAVRRAACRLVEALDYVGVAGLELFVLRNGSVLANEFAPRVHNSGHWTEAACAVSQFEQHIRAIAGLPLGATDRHNDCVMENLIGDDVERAGSLLAEPGAVLHLYGKRETRPGRKMGHVTHLRPLSGEAARGKA